ncbi:MAG: 3-hydroxyacyl-CoA dehydrogenase family protein, partial [Dehalococcoidia bacterium]|nr:3-hydroxyacyl-CoA dehydrogenase family protein [Dehalococcoidia bacterium]
TKGYEVSMTDIEDRIVQNGLNAVKSNLKKYFVDKGKMTQEDADKVVGRIKGTVDLKQAVSGAQLVLEGIPEVMELKQQTFKQLDELCPPETILASNTSALSITAIGSLTRRQDKVIGMHFFNPVGIMKLVEIICGIKTSQETTQVIKDVAAKLDKETIVVNKDVAGFVVTRLFLVFCNEAVKLLEEGVASAEDIDKGCQLGLGHAMGPFKSQDLVNGIPVAVHALDYMRSELGESYRPRPLWRRKVEAGELGVNAGKGFYDYSQQK